MKKLRFSETQIIKILNEAGAGIQLKEICRNFIEVREATYWWMIEYNEQRPHDSLGDLAPAEYMLKNSQNSILELST
ncbi:hypothetical protein DSLASN_05440 [Desulfoluna limicola]|uniref:Integrase catalytic domain-containing protein n=1 Tax=Desulfoluna limicola TaxID=2810562 RepID=A0ABN6F0S5_9BACT|nr:hypothetical protein DSLASN_05440 [Desulfoluna limicola]